MKYCFIIANKRCSYFNLEKVILDIKEPVRFIHIIDEHYVNKLPDLYREHIDQVCAVAKIDFTCCLDAIVSQLKGMSANDSGCIVCTDEKSLIVAAQLREHFGWNGAKPYQYISFSSKRLMKQILNIHGIKTPKFLDFTGEYAKNYLVEYHNYLQNLFGGQYIVKPLDGGGSADTAKVASAADLIHWFNNSYSAKEEYEAEECIDGAFFMCDSFVINNEPRFAAISEYMYPCLDFTLGKPLGAFPLFNNEKLANDIFQFNKKVIKALQPPDGATHLEFFVKHNEITFIEIGARPPGQAVCLTHEKNYGINPYEMTLRLELGLPLDFTIKQNLFHSWISLSSTPGVVKKLNTLHLKGKYNINWHIKVGDTIKNFPSSLKEGVSAEVELFNTDYKELLEDINMLRTYKPY